MRRRRLHLLVLAAFLARVVLPAFHFHEEGGHGGECHHHEHGAQGPALGTAEPGCAVCELLAVKAQWLAPEEPRAAETSRPPAAERSAISLPAPRDAAFSVVGAPRGPPPSSPA